MRLIRDLDILPGDCCGGAVSIGNFDGIHRGHARIVRRLVQHARRLDGPAVLFTFDPHPAALLRPEALPPPLTSIERKAELLAELGVDAVIAYPTDRALLNLDAAEFFEEILRDRLAARAVVEGYNFQFGRGRSGTVDTLRALCQQGGLSLDIVEPVEIDGQVVSSSRIRALVARGEVDLAGRMLTQPYRILGSVEHGAGRGAGLGYPTANVAGVETLLPAEGIYCGRGWSDGRSWPAAISLGANPTFGERELKIEVHLLDYRGDLYGRQLGVEFLSRLRGVERFGDVGELVAQMDRDIAACRRIVAETAATK
ncbi:MAG: bifunctional riboflavin kinase/FAD synthetase [Rhodopirellula sp.]|nr:bifunctional riboflavin kinase/FAD synthetase [Rhodopirellula sp.]